LFSFRSPQFIAVEDSPCTPLVKGGWGDLSGVLHSSETRYRVILPLLTLFIVIVNLIR